MVREIRVLNVAEKPSVAREITRHLGGHNVSRRRAERERADSAYMAVNFNINIVGTPSQ